MTHSVRLIAVTKPAIPEFESTEALIAYCARVSSPRQENPEISRLLRYCIRHEHWSVFEMGNLVVEIETSRAISQQILRHRSFSFQEFSLRYAEAAESIVYPARRQDTKNRQNSIDDLDGQVKQWFDDAQLHVASVIWPMYKNALDLGIAKEQARFLLPLATKTKLYMNGTLRSWLTYLDLRMGHGTQLEHQEIANDIKKIFVEQFPVISEAMWPNEEE